jgi:signal transduction histidine kinase
MTKEPAAERTLSITRLFAGTKRPVFVAVSELVPHVHRIRSQWIKLLKERFKMDRVFVRTLSKLNLETQYENLGCGDFNAYASALELQGRLFENRSVTIELAVAAMVCYFEACQPYLSSGRSKESVGALLRFTWASQLVLIQGFTMQYNQRRQELEQRLQESERHFRRFSIHVVGLYEQTGRRIARDLHDEIGHNLLVLKLYLELMSVDLNHGHSEQIGTKIEEAVDLIAHAIDGVRRLAFNLGPAILEKAGLVATVRRYAGQFTRRTGINVQFHIDVPVKLPSIYEVTLYRVLQGALSNVVAHSKAGNVEVNLGVQNRHLWMSVEDNGNGFDIKKTLNDPSQAFGLVAIRQRVELLGGSLRMESWLKRLGKRGSGTRIEIQIPLEGSEAA